MEFRFTEEIIWSLPFITILCFGSKYFLCGNILIFQRPYECWFLSSPYFLEAGFDRDTLSLFLLIRRFICIISCNLSLLFFFSKEGFMYLSEKQSYREETGEIFCLLVLFPQWLPRLRLLQVTASSQEFRPSPSQESSAGDWIQSGAAGTCTSIPMGCWHCRQWLNSTQQRWSQCSFISEE